ncbi:ribosomal L1 domain-containing protein 1-like [Saccostrea echinata]|uniref:ribosomal L1 domain-containing protein 1-like n=1 Tax=Saccostrea echinata TaxID=191078 RepID=UPI002A81840C|nr:ribosomal L1 domain-containing protein 1-like [Saccostrea echinata]
MESKTLEVSTPELRKAVAGLLKLIKVADKKSDILQERERINLQINMKKIPNMPELTIQMNLPHGLFTPDTDVCLFVKDLDKTSREFELTEDHFRDMLVDKGVNCIRKIIPLKELKLEYKPFEAKRNLSNEFGLFLADKRIMRLLPSLLGKNFYGRKRNPIQVDLEAKNLKAEVTKAVNSTRCIIKNRGSSSVVTIGHTEQSCDQIVDNVLKAIELLSQKFPGGPDNIKSLQVKTDTSMSIPFYMSLDIGESVVFPERKRAKKQFVIEEVTTVTNGKVKVTEDGRVRIIKSGGSKKRKNRKRNSSEIKGEKSGEKKEGIIEGEEEVEIKIEYDSQEEMNEEPAQKKAKKTPKRDSKKTEAPAGKMRTPMATDIGSSLDKEDQKSGKKKTPKSLGSAQMDVQYTQTFNKTSSQNLKKTPKSQRAKKEMNIETVIKQEDEDEKLQAVQTPLSVKKSKGKTLKSPAIDTAEKKTPKSEIKQKVAGKTPKSVTIEKTAKKLKEVTPPTVKRLQTKVKTVTPGTPSRKQKKN